MSIKPIGLGLATAAVVVVGSMATAPAKAIDLFPGSFQVNSQAQFTGSKVGNTVTIDLAKETFDLTGLGGVFATQITGPATGNFVADLVLTDNNDGTFTSGVINNFISGLNVDGEAIALNLSSSTFNGFFNAADNFVLGGVGLNGTLVSALSGQVQAHSTITSLQIGSSEGFSTVAVATVPTPAAVLPALLGLGTAAFRKKNEGEDELAVANAKEA